MRCPRSIIIIFIRFTQPAPDELPQNQMLRSFNRRAVGEEGACSVSLAEGDTWLFVAHSDLCSIVTKIIHHIGSLILIYLL